MNINNHSREEIALWAEGGGEARERWILYKVLMFVIALFLLLPGSLLVSIGWSYFGGGPEFEKVHPATYLLVAVFSWALIVNRSFRWRCIAYSVSDCAFIAFALAALSTVTFAIAVSGASASNFIDTFVVALIIRIAIVAVPRRPMVQFRTFIDIYCIVTIVVVFAEYMLNRNFVLSDLLPPRYPRRPPPSTMPPPRKQTRIFARLGCLTILWLPPDFLLCIRS